MAIRLIKAVIVATIALFFTLVSFNNLTDFETNRAMVSHVVSLDTVPNSKIYWRAVLVPEIQLAIYDGIIIWEILTAAFCWAGAFRMLLAKEEQFAKIKGMALTGIAMGFVVYMVGFVDLASEWFYLWQSTELEGGQIKGILFSLLMLLSLSFVATPEASLRSSGVKRTPPASSPD